MVWVLTEGSSLILPSSMYSFRRSWTLTTLNSSNASGNQFLNPARVAKYACPHSGSKMVLHFNRRAFSRTWPACSFQASSSPEKSPQLTPSQFSEETVQSSLAA